MRILSSVNADWPLEDTAVHEYVPGYGRELSYHDIFYANTECFPVSFPTSTNLLTNICGNDKNMIKKTLDYASNSRSGKDLLNRSNLVVLPKSVAHLMAEFLTIKQKYGTNVEKQVFKGMTVEVRGSPKCHRLTFHRALLQD